MPQHFLDLMVLDRLRQLARVEDFHCQTTVTLLRLRILRTPLAPWLQASPQGSRQSLASIPPNAPTSFAHTYLGSSRTVAELEHGSIGTQQSSKLVILDTTASLGDKAHRSCSNLP